MSGSHSRASESTQGASQACLPPRTSFRVLSHITDGVRGNVTAAKEWLHTLKTPQPGRTVFDGGGGQGYRAWHGIALEPICYLRFLFFSGVKTQLYRSPMLITVIGVACRRSFHMSTLSTAHVRINNKVAAQNSTNRSSYQRNEDDDTSDDFTRFGPARPGSVNRTATSN